MITRNRCAWRGVGVVAVATVILFGCGGGSSSPPHNMSPGFHIEEATIADIQTAIQKKEITCVDLVKVYLARITAYNGPCTRLVTADGAPISPATGYVRAGAPISFPTETVPVSDLLPDLDQYQGPPLDLGRMDPSVTNPGIVQQMGVITGIPHAAHVNALETVNIRGERSQSCRGEFDKAPADGPLSAEAPPECEAFRQMPDALERAAQLDAQYGSSPDLKALPMYCVALSVKDWYDAKDMRSAGGNDVAFAMDAPPTDATLVARLRDKGAIILAKAIATQVTNTSDAGPVAPAKLFFPPTDNARATWGGAACTPYDTERSPGFSSGGVGASVAANLVTCGICETTGGSCRIPANPNAVASLVTTKGIISSDGGWTAEYTNHRPGILCRTLGDSARVLDAMKDPEDGYFDPNDIFTALPPPLVSDQPYASFLTTDAMLAATPKILAGTRVGLVREFFIKPLPNNVAINDKIDAEVKAVLRDQLGADLVESVDALYPDDPTVPNMTFTFQDSIAEVLPITAPEYFAQKVGDQLEFAVPGWDVTSKNYLVALSLHQAPLSGALNLRRLTSGGLDNAQRTPFLMDRYLKARADRLVTDWPSFVANASFFADNLRSGSMNVAELDTQNIAATSGSDRLKMVTAARMIVEKVMLQNGLDVLVIPNIPAPVEKNEHARDPVTQGVRSNGPSITDLLGVPEVIVPAGYNDIVYDAQYQLSADKKSYVAVAGTVQSTLPEPMPISMMFWAGAGEEPKVLKIASAYEAATHHRMPPADFGPLPDEP